MYLIQYSVITVNVMATSLANVPMSVFVVNVHLHLMTLGTVIALSLNALIVYVTVLMMLLMQRFFTAVLYLML